MHLPASIENTHGDMNSYSCAAGVIKQCLFDDAIDGQVNERGVCWNTSGRFGPCAVAMRSVAIYSLRMATDIINTDSLLAFSLCLSLMEKYTDVGCFPLQYVLCALSHERNY